MRYALIFTFLLSFTAKAQDTSGYNLKNQILFQTRLLDTQYLETRFLYDRCLPISNIGVFDGEYDTVNTYDNWRQIYRELSIANLDNNQLEPLEPLSNRLLLQSINDTVPLSMIRFRYDQILYYAVDSNLLNYDNDSALIDIFPRLKAPYETDTVFAMTAFRKVFYVGTTHFIVSASNLFTNISQEGIYEVDFGDGVGWRAINWELAIPINYSLSDTGKLTISLRLFTPSDTFVSHSEHEVMATMSAMEADEIINLTATIPFEGAYGSGLLSIKYGNDAEGEPHTCITKPILILDGVDFGSSDRPVDQCADGRCGYLGWPDLINPPDDEPALKKMPVLIQQLLDSGYDVLFLDNGHGAQYIQRNAMLFVKAIQYINDNKCTCEEIAVMGPSMGGLVSRYGLRYMEQNNITSCVKLWISVDAPHQGANIPLGAQCFIKYCADAESEAAMQAKAKLDHVASQQMLYLHYKNELNDGPTGYRTEFLAELSTLGYPARNRRVAISNGSRTQNPQAFDGGDQLIDYNWYRGVVNINGNVWALPGDPIAAQVCVVFEGDRPDARSLSFARACNDPHYDNAPGCIRDDLKLFKGRQFYYWYNRGRKKHKIPVGRVIVNHEQTCFMPTISTLDINTTNLLYPVNNISRIEPNPSLHPFYAFTSPANNNELHIEITDDNIQWIFQQLFLNRDPFFASQLPNARGLTYNYGNYKRKTPTASMAHRSKTVGASQTLPTPVGNCAGRPNSFSLTLKNDCRGALRSFWPPWGGDIP